MSDIADRVLSSIDAYSAKVDKTAAEFRRRLDTLESSDPRAFNDAVLALGRRVEMSAPLREGITNFVRKGSSQEYLSNYLVKAAAGSMTVGSDPDGGYVVLPEFDTAIRTLSREISPMRQLANVRTISGDSLKMVAETGALPTAAWVGEQEARPQTIGSTLSTIDLPLAKSYAMPVATRQLLDDASVDIASWLLGRIAFSLSTLEGSAFINGTGNKQPKGLLTYPLDSRDDATRPFGSFQYFAAGGSSPTNAQLAAALTSVSEALRPQYANSSCVWLMNRKTRAAIRSLTYSSTDSRLLWSPSGNYADKRSDELLGFPVIIEPNMPDLGTANALPIAIGDISQAFTVIDQKKGITVLLDPYQTKGYVAFYVTKKTGGGASGDFSAVKFVKLSAS